MALGALTHVRLLEKEYIAGEAGDHVKLGEEGGNVGGSDPQRATCRERRAVGLGRGEWGRGPRVGVDVPTGSE
jgi:hypothetical protein